MRRPLVLVVLALSSATLAACGEDTDPTEPQGGSQTSVPEQTGGAGETPSGEPSVEPSVDEGRLVAPTVVGEAATGLQAPWSVAFLPDGQALVSERDSARIMLLDGAGAAAEVGEVPDVVPAGEGGLLGLAISPDFATDQLVYAYRSAPGSVNQIVRMTFDGATLGTPEVVLDGIPSNTIHNGGRIHFGPDGMLYAGVGDAGNTGAAQDIGSLSGKILRMMPDGSVPPDNPLDGLVWSYGHRNVQGFGWNEDGTMFASEFGQDTYDELNLIEPGNNYGWPVAEGVSGLDGMVDPVVQWATDDASPSGVAVVDGQVYLAGLRGERLWQVPNPGSDRASSLEPVAWFSGEYGRLRDVVVAPDGNLWLVTNNTDGRGSPRDGDDRILIVQRTLG